jgi:Mg/Co/Ni transporter MgtE
MTSLTLPAYAAVRFDVPATIEIRPADLTKVLEAIPLDDLDDAFALLPSDKQGQILQSILTDKSIEWMLTEAVRRVTVDKVPTEAATLRAIVQCVQEIKDIYDDEDCAAAITEIRRVVGGAG